MSDLENEFTTEVVEAEAPAPRMIIVDKRLEVELELYKRATGILLGVEE